MFPNLTTRQRHHFPIHLLEVFEDIANNHYGHPEDEEGGNLRVGFFLEDSNSPETYLAVFYLRGEHYGVLEFSYEDLPLDPKYYDLQSNEVAIVVAADNDPEDDGPMIA